MIRRGGLFLLLALTCPGFTFLGVSSAFAQSVTITSPLNGSLDHGTITVKATNNPSSDYLKWYGPAESNGACPSPLSLDQGSCTVYTGGNGSFSFDLTQLPNGPTGIAVQEFPSNGAPADAQARVDFTIGTPTPSPSPTPAPNCSAMMTAPAPNSVISGTVTSTVNVQNCGTDYTKWYLPDGTNVYGVLSVTFDTTKVKNGANQFGVQIFTQQQRYTGVSSFVNVTIQNAAPTSTPTITPTPNSSPTPPPTATATPPPTATNTPTASASPTSTTSASPSPTPSPTATGTPTGLAGALLGTMSADFRIVTDQGAYGPDLATAESNASQMLAYLGLPNYRTDFTCDAAVWGSGCDSRSLVTTYLNTLPYNWIVLPYTGPGNNTIADITGFQIPVTQNYMHLKAIEVGNEINNNCPSPPFQYNGLDASCSGLPTWAGGAQWSADMYKTIKSVYGPNMPVFSWINPAFDHTNDGLQYAGVNTTPSNLPVLADYADVHPYPNFSGSVPPDFVTTTALELGTGGPDNGMSGNFCQTTVTGGFPTYGSTSTLCAQIPRVITEFGIEFSKTSEEQKAAIDTNFFVIAYLRGWTTLNSLYAVADTTTGFGLFESGVPPSQVVTATSFAVHNLSNFLKQPNLTGTAVCPTVSGNAQPTDYMMCGSNWMLATGDRASGEHVETWTLNVPSTATWTDMVTGTSGTGNTISVDDHLVGVSW